MEGLAKRPSTRRILVFISQLDLNVRKTLVKRYIWNITLYGAEILTLRKIYQKYLESFEMWCWKRMDKVRLTDLVKKVLHGVKEEKIILHTIK